MLKNLTCYLLILTVFIITNYAFANQTPKSLLILNMENKLELPKNFRTTQDPFVTSDGPQPSREGYDQLKISGSSQFSENSLIKILEKLEHPKNLTIIDLREENHGFLDGAAVSWYGVKDWENVGKSLKHIEKEERRRLSTLMRQKKAIVATEIEKDPEGNQLPKGTPLSWEINSIATEKQIAAKHKVKYFRIPVTDHLQPSNENVDRFIAFVKHLPANHWLHFHCAAGIGRTSSFMVMYDMMKNAKKVSLKDILDRQMMIGGRDIRKLSDSPWKAFAIQDRILFIEQFYDYCRNNQDNFETTWSLYLILKRVPTTEKTSE